MGVDLGDISIKRPITLEMLSGKQVAIDAFNTLYQFLASIRQEDGTPLQDSHGNITAHLSGLFYRTSKLIESGIKPIYVFDGKVPEFKFKKRLEREQTKKDAEEKWKKALEEERYEDAKKFAQATSRLTHEMVDESKELLKAMGIPVVQAPSEGEAQASMMVENGEAYASASQDYDSLLFGSPRLVRNINITGKRKVPRQNRFINIEPEEIILKETLEALGVSREQLIIVGILVGTDFNEGVMRVGPKTALKIVKERKTFDEVKGHVREKYNYEFEKNIDEVYDFFMNPPHEKTGKLKAGRLDENRIKTILCEKHEFSEERIERVMEKIKNAVLESNSQSKLDNWF
ncbi:MAG: flap endonuclease-1 [Candidatus Micrarchaeota archaeon]